MVTVRAHLETRRDTRKKTSDVYDADCHFIINMKVNILKVDILKDFHSEGLQL